MTLTELRTKANTKLAPFWAMLVEKQPLYFAKHGKFFQFLVTPRVVDGADTGWQMVNPSDEKNVPDITFSWSDLIPFRISVDEWAGENVGFSATATVELPNGEKYRRTRKATAVISEAVFNNADPMNPVLITPRQISSFLEEDTNWQLVRETI